MAALRGAAILCSWFFCAAFFKAVMISLPSCWFTPSVSLPLLLQRRTLKIKPTYQGKNTGALACQRQRVLSCTGRL